MADIQIFKLEAKHKEIWSLLWEKYLCFYKTTKNSNIYEKSFNNLTDKNEKNAEGFIVFYNDQAVGIANCIYHLHFWQSKKICYLQDLFIDEKYRNKGIAKKLINHIYKTTIDNKNVENMYWLTENSNHNAKKLYDKIAELTPFVKYNKNK